MCLKVVIEPSSVVKKVNEQTKHTSCTLSIHDVDQDLSLYEQHNNKKNTTSQNGGKRRMSTALHSANEASLIQLIYMAIVRLSERPSISAAFISAHVISFLSLELCSLFALLSLSLTITLLLFGTRVSE